MIDAKDSIEVLLISAFPDLIFSFDFTLSRNPLSLPGFGELVGLSASSYSSVRLL